MFLKISEYLSLFPGTTNSQIHLGLAVEVLEGMERACRAIGTSVSKH